MVGKARALYEELRRALQVEYDDGGAIGRRYRRQDEIGTPFAFTIDEQTLEDDTVTMRDRDSLAQERVPIGGVRARIADLLARGLALAEDVVARSRLRAAALPARSRSVVQVVRVGSVQIAAAGRNGPFVDREAHESTPSPCPRWSRARRRPPVDESGVGDVTVREADLAPSGRRARRSGPSARQPVHRLAGSPLGPVRVPSMKRGRRHGRSADVVVEP